MKKQSVRAIFPGLWRDVHRKRDRRVRGQAVPEVRAGGWVFRFFGRLRAWCREVESFLSSYNRLCGYPGLPANRLTSGRRLAWPNLPFRDQLGAVRDGLIGIGIFSLTMPTMKVAVRDLDPVFVGVGRLLVAVIPAAITLMVLKSPLPHRRQWLSLLTVVGCLAFGFSLFLAQALVWVPSFHAAIVAGAVPLVIALVATIRERHPQSVSFWLAALAGALTVIIYGLAKSSWSFTHADLLLIAVAIVGGIGYAEGGRLGKEMGPLAVSCWVPVVATPFALLVCASKMPESLQQVPASAWLALGQGQRR